MIVNFYETTQEPIEKVLPKIVEKIYVSQKRCLILCKDMEQVQSLNTLLWTYSQLSFLPHGCAVDMADFKAQQPIWLSTIIDMDDPNVIVNLTFTPIEVTSVERIIEIFSTLDQTIADKKFLFYRKHCVPQWFIQTPKGEWSKKE
jgi:DNA polymerase-3 subunit chi